MYVCVNCSKCNIFFHDSLHMKRNLVLLLWMFHECNSFHLPHRAVTKTALYTEGYC